MTATMPCSWEVLECGALPATGSAQYDEIKSAAAEVLWALSGRVFGTCEVTVRPCRDACAEPCLPPAGAWDSVLQWTPVLSNGQWINVACRSCGPRCSCPEVCEVLLPGPVDEVVEVRVDGAVVDEATYRIDDGEWLVRVNDPDGGRLCWPACQDQSLPPTAEGTFAVTYMRGTPAGPGGQRALGEMMSELYKACGGDSTCCLPRRVIYDARRNVQALDPMSFLKDGKTGLYWTDLWLSAVNPLARPSGARVISPDWDEGRVTTWPPS